MYDFSSGCCDPQFDSAKTAIVNKSFDMDNRVLHRIQGRWLQPDPARLNAVDLSNPQTWNRYAYVMNNPLSFIDPTGLACWPFEKQRFGTCAPFMNNGVNFGANWNLFYLFMGWTSCENGDCGRYTVWNGLDFAVNQASAFWQWYTKPRGLAGAPSICVQRGIQSRSAGVFHLQRV